MKHYLLFIKYFMLFLLLRRIIYFIMTNWQKKDFYSFFSVSDTDFNPNVTAIIAGLAYEESFLYSNKKEYGLYGQIWYGNE